MPLLLSCGDRILAGFPLEAEIGCFSTYPSRVSDLLSLDLLDQLLHLLIASVLLQEVAALRQVVGGLSQEVLVVITSGPQASVRLARFVLGEVAVGVLQSTEIVPVAMQFVQEGLRITCWTTCTEKSLQGTAVLT